MEVIFDMLMVNLGGVILLVFLGEVFNMIVIDEMVFIFVGVLLSVFMLVEILVVN